MKLKLRLPFKNFSGTLDELNYASYGDRGTIVRMLPVNRELTEQNEVIGSRASKIASFYAGVSDGFKQDLELYTLKMYNLKEFRNRIAGNKYSTFNKLMWAASKALTNPVDLDSLSVDDLSMGSYNTINTVKDIVDNGFLPKVDGYEELTATIGA